MQKYICRNTIIGGIILPLTMQLIRIPGIDVKMTTCDNMFLKTRRSLIIATSYGSLGPQKVAFWKGNGTPAISGKSRLVKYDNLARKIP